MKKINFTSKKDGKSFVIEVPSTKNDFGGEFVKINDKVWTSEEETDYDIPEKVKKDGELVYSKKEIYDLYYYQGNFYDFYWDTASGCIFCKLSEE